MPRQPIDRPLHRLAHRLVLVLTVLALLALPGRADAAGGAGGSGGSGGSGDRLDYVALGDSYSAASGVLPLDPTAFPGCLRSTRNYPHVLAGEIGADLTDVTCGAADTGDFAGAQYPGLVPPQLDALGAGTDLVTMTIGGNDSGVFLDAILSCGTLGTAHLGLGDPCRRRFGSSFEDTIRTTTYPALVAALEAVHDRAPGARVAILGYSWIVPPTRGCFPVLPIARGDVPYLRSLQSTLNDAVRRAAEATGTTYVDLAAASTGHDACTPLGTRWVEPVLTTTNPVIVHPNALGERQMAAQAAAQLGLD
jgi:lysophospholipase L1-like esterase